MTTNGKLARIRAKPITNIDRARVRAAKRAKTRKTLNAVEQPLPAFLLDECEEPSAGFYRIPPVFRQPDVSPESSGLCGRDVTRVSPTHAHKNRSPRLGLALIIITAVLFYGSIYLLAGGGA